MMNAYSDHVILGYLRNLLRELERKLSFPKNDWRRREELLAEIRDVKQRIVVFEKASGLIPLSTPKPQTAADSDRFPEGAVLDSAHSGDRNRIRKLEVEYR